MRRRCGCRWSWSRRASRAAAGPAAVGRFGAGDTIRTLRHRLAEYVGPRGTAAGRMLFDHEADPGERVNLAARDAGGDLAERLSAELRDRRSRIPGPAE